MKTIKLTQGMVAMVDDEDFDMVSAYSWFANRINNIYYASRKIRKENGKRTDLRLHRFILGITDADVSVDHKNGNGLDNRRENLRVCTQANNALNRAINKNNSTGYPGVRWYESRKKFRADIQFNKRKISLGYFDDAVKASEAYDAKAKELFGEFYRSRKRVI